MAPTETQKKKEKKNFLTLYQFRGTLTFTSITRKNTDVRHLYKQVRGDRHGDANTQAY